MQEKYGIEFSVAGREELKNYGPFHGATYFCEVSPVDAPEQIATAVVSPMTTIKGPLQKTC